ncbi:MAG: hypothetical protein ACPG6V_08830 [Flavobacteriales bacterium]
MQSFINLKELISGIKREEKLLSEMFTQRQNLSFTYDMALKYVDNDESRLNYLIERSVLRMNDRFLEIDYLYLQFFENTLEVNDEISISYVNENLQHIKDNILYFYNERNENRKYSYLRTIKSTFRKIGQITLRNVIDLRRNIETTFKNEPNYKNKKAKLEKLDVVRETIINVVFQTQQLINEDEAAFFKSAFDEELHRIKIDLKLMLSESMHNLIEIEKQIINYLNQIKHQSGIIEKLRKLKHLKDQFTINAQTNLVEVLNERNDVFFETPPAYGLPLSIDYLVNNDDALETIRLVARKIARPVAEISQVADSISDDYLGNLTQENDHIDLFLLKEEFKMESENLFEFILSYPFETTISFESKVSMFCQMVSQFENEFKVESEYKTFNDIEFALVFPN